MKFTLIIPATLLVLFSCSNPQKHQEYNADSDGEIIAMQKPCADPWVVHSAIHNEVEERNVMSNSKNVFLRGKLWFEMTNISKYDSLYSICNLKYYRTNGSLQEEGFALYKEHPAKEYLGHGKWKYYDCDGILRETLLYEWGKFVED